MLFLERENDKHLDQMMLPGEYLARNYRMLFLNGPLTMIDLGLLGPTSLRTDVYGPLSICDTLLALDKLSDEPIKLVIDSPGGHLNVAMTLYDTIKNMRAPVWTICRQAASAAVIILTAGTQGHRYVYEHSRLMLHHPYANLGVVTPGEGRRKTKELTRVLEQIAEVLQTCGVHRTTKEIIRDIEKEKWMSAQEAIDYGLVDHILGKEVL